MPVAAVTGRADIMDLTGRAGGRTVKFSGGTYSGHPAAMIATLTMIDHLVENEAAIYGRLGEIATELRRVVVESFSNAGIHVRFTGDQIHDLPNNSLHMLVFPRKQDLPLDTPENVYNPEHCDMELSENILQRALLLENVYTVHGLGANSAAHTIADLEYLGGAISRVADLIKPAYQGP